MHQGGKVSLRWRSEERAIKQFDGYKTDELKARLSTDKFKGRLRRALISTEPLQKHVEMQDVFQADLTAQ